MEIDIIPKREWFRGGINLEITVAVKPDEYDVINNQNMWDIVILPRTDDQSVRFKDFYNRTLSYWFPNKREAGEIERELRERFEKFMGHLKDNSRQMRSLHIELSGQPKPYSLPDEKRFEHMFVQGSSGSGKTNFLSSMIQTDLDKVLAGKACVVIMDSQKAALTHNLPRSVRFHTGGDLEGKLLFLELTKQHPPALNMFALNAEIEAKQFLLSFFIGTTMGAVTGHTRIIITHAMEALEGIPNATIRDFRNMLENPAGKGNVAKPYDLSHVDADTKDFLTRRLFSANYAATVSALSSRLDNLTINKFFRGMFAQPENRFDLYEETLKPQVIIISTNKGETQDNCEVIGRYFLAQLIHVTRKRLTTHQRLPVYFYCDEVHDYLKDEPRAVELLDETRKQDIALIFATQREGKIANDQVKSALLHVTIQATCRKPNVTLRIDQDDPVISWVPPVDFKKQPQIQEKDFSVFQAAMYKRFSPPPRAQPSAAPIPDDDAPDC